MEITIPETFTEEADPLPPSPVTSEDSTLYNHYIENLDPKAIVRIDFDGDNATISVSKGSVTSTTNGAHVTLTTNRRTLINISGTSNNASLTILPSDPTNKDNQYRCGVNLNGVSLHNPHGAVINSQLKKRLLLNSLPGTENTLSCGAPETAEATPDAAIYGKGCIFSEDKIVLSATKSQGIAYGKFNITSSFRSCIAADDYVIIRPNVRLVLNAKEGNGIKTNDGVFVNGGQTTIFCDGTTRLNSVPVSAECPEGIDTVTCAAIKTDSTIVVSNGLLQMRSTGDDSKGIKTKHSYIQNGGEVNIVTLGRQRLSSPKAIKSEKDIAINAGKTYCYSSHSLAIEANGTVAITPPHTINTHTLKTE